MHCAQTARSGLRRALLHRQVNYAARRVCIRPHATTRLEDWLVERGGKVNGVQLKVEGKMRELRATEDLEPGRLLISVPKTCQVRYDDAELQQAVASQPWLAALFDRVPKGSDTGEGAWQFRQALTLLWHLSRGPASPLSDYLQLLPGRAGQPPAPKIGMLFGDAIVEELQHTPLMINVMNHKYWWDQFTAELPAEAEAAGVTRDSFGWAVSVAMSRSFGLRRARVHSMPALIDMANHAPAEAANCEIRSSTEDGSISMYATRKVASGSPLLLCYGLHDNSNLLLSYGFVMQPENLNDRMDLEWSVETLLACAHQFAGAPEREAPAPWQVALLAQLGLPSTAPDTPPDESSDGSSELAAPASFAPEADAAAAAAAAVPAASGGPGGSASSSGTGSGSSMPGVWVGHSRNGGPHVDPLLLAAARVLTLDEGSQALAEEQLKAGKLGDWAAPLGRQHEIQVMKLLSGLITAIYKSFPTTIQQDRKAVESFVLAGDDLEGLEDLALAVQFRLSLKLALESSLKAVMARSKELEALQTVR